ncbi:MAG TPA: MinD/ParA family protein [Phycisphaerae bacterium]|jgi:flagellar biosynthesis protein FlhG|nr:MinD/ParA family protein [Phycisphaerae bacterium]
MTVMDQATHLRAIARRSEKRAQTIAITSGKGGVGKTNLSVNLASVLAAMRRRVVLLDADLGLANADILCNVQPKFNLAHVVAGQRQLCEVLTPVPAGFSLIPGASGLAKMADLSEADRKRILHELDTVDESADALIIDTGAGIGRNVLSFTSTADHVVVVTTPEPTAITDAYAVMKVLVRCGTSGRISVMVNMARNREEALQVHERIASVARQFLKTDIAFSGFVVSDAAVQQAVRKRAPFVCQYPNSAAAQCVQAWANRIDHSVDVRQIPGKPGFFARLASWWR